MDKEALLKLCVHYFRLTEETARATMVEMRIRCLTPQSLLSEVGAVAEDVDALFLDTEGYDARLMMLFLAMNSFRPAVIEIEWFPSDPDMVLQVVRMLHSRSYAIFMFFDNIVALQYLEALEDATAQSTPEYGGLQS